MIRKVLKGLVMLAVVRGVSRMLFHSKMTHKMAESHK